MKRLSSQLIFSTFLLFTSTMLFAGPTGSDPFDGGVAAERAAHTEHLMNLLHHPFVAIQQANAAPAVILSGPDGILFQDLRGVECYAQPDCFVVCGAADTIPFLLLTKSIEPIENIDIRLNFSEGLEFSSFAFVQSGNAVLDITNDANPEAPSFNLDEISQAGGGVVVYIGVRAQCDIDLVNAPPTITYNLDYTAGGQVCNDAITPPTYGGEIARADVRFQTELPILATITALGETAAGCIDIPLLSLDPKAAAGGIRLLATNYGAADGVRLYSVLDAMGNEVPGAAAFDGTTGTSTIDLPGSALDVDGDGLFGTGDGSQSVQLCFAIDACPITAPITMDLALGVSCDGASCGSIDQFNTATLNILPAFNPVLISTFEVIQDLAFCNADGMPQAYIIESSITSNNTTPVLGDVYDLFYRINSCVEGLLALNRIYIVDAAGAEVADIPAIYYARNALGRLDINYRLFTAATGDLDGPGVGLDDLDGDGIFNDLPAGESFTIRLEFMPDCASTSCTPAADPPLVCDFTRQSWFYLRNCNTGRQAEARINITDDGIGPVTNNSTGQFDNEVAINANTDGYQFENSGDFGGNTGVATSENVSFTYNLNAMDFASCDGDSDLALVLSIVGDSAKVADLEISNFIFDGTAIPVMDTTDVGTPGFRTITFNAGDPTQNMDFTFTFDATFDLASCQGTDPVLVDAYLVENCVGCECNITRACASTVFIVDPATLMDCNPGATTVDVCNLSPGYTDRSLSTRIDYQNPPNIEDKNRFIPGDTLRLTGSYIVEQADIWNTINDLLRFQVFHAEADRSASGIRDNLTSRIDLPNARIQRFELERLDGTIIDLGAISVPGGPSLTGGIKVGGFFAPFDPTVIHPGVSSSDYTTFFGSNRVNDYEDQGRYAIDIGRPIFYPNAPDALSVVLDLIGGAFQDGDKFNLILDVPMVSTPRVLGGGAATPNVFQERGFFTLNAGGFSRIGTASIGTTLTADRTSDFYDFAEPGINLTSTLEYADDCEAVLVQRFEVDNVPEGWFTDQFKPAIGIEDLEVNIPMPYALGGDVVYTHADQPSVVAVPDSTSNLDTVAYSGGEVLLPVTTSSGQLQFVDAEKTDGLRADNYFGWDTGDDDATLVGGTFPLLGVGLGTTEAAPDFLEFRIPLFKVCGTATQGIPNPSTFNASYRYLADYNTDGYICNFGSWYGGAGPSRTFCADNGLPSMYWPWTRDADDNPHHLANDEIVNTMEVGTIPTNYTAVGSNFAAPILLDGAGTETNTYTLSLDQAIAGGTLVITSEFAVELQTINGIAPTLVTTTADANIYSFDLGPLATGDQTFDFVTNLAFCGPGELCVDPVLGCPLDPADAADIAEIIVKSGKQCGDDPVCFTYLSGLADTRLDWDVPTPVNCGATEPYTLTLSSIGSSAILNPILTLFQPTGLTLTNLMASLDGAAPVAFTLPTTGTEGVYGVPMSNVAGGLPDIPEGGSLVITFDGALDCDFVYGNSVTAQLSGDVFCDRAYESLPVSSAPLALAPDPTGPSLSVEPSMTDINCSEGGGRVVITSANTGKSATGPSTICLNLPAGIDVTAADVNVIAPEGFVISDFVTAPLGDGQQVTFSGPDLDLGAIFCLEVNFNIGNIDCGPVDIGYNLKVDQDVSCTPAACGPIPVNIGGAGLIRFNVVPEAGEIEGMVFADCSDTPGNVLVSYAVDVTNNGSDYTAKPVTIEAFYDFDGDGLVDLTAGDVSLGTTTENLTLGAGQMTTITGSFDVDEELACALVLRVESPSCTCGELFLPFSEVLPSFLNDLGNSVVVCPGEAFTLDGICFDTDFTFEPPGAGTVDASVDGEVTVMVNPAFAGIAVKLVATVTVGSCVEQVAKVNILELENFSYGPFEATLCDEGCQIVDLGIPIAQQEDLMISIVSSSGITDPTSFEPEFCPPILPGLRTVSFMLDGTCMTTANLNIVVVNAPVITLSPASAQCQTGFSLPRLATITPATLDGTWTTTGDGTFDVNPTYSTAERYVPGPGDIAAQEVTLTLRTDNPDGPCGVKRAKAEITILLVDCGSFFWDGSND